MVLRLRLKLKVIEISRETVVARLEELGQEMIGLVRLNARAGMDTSAY